MRRSLCASAAAVAFLSGHALAQTCAPIPPPPRVDGVIGQNCSPPAGPPPMGVAPRTSGPCGAPCYQNAWYGNTTISPLKGVPTLRNSCIPFACGYNYTDWEGALNGNHIDNAVGYPVNATGSTPKAFAVECTSEIDQARVLVSNGLPSQLAYIQSPGFLPCEAPFFVKLPLNPQVVDNTNGAFEVPLRGPIAVSLQGIAILSAQDAGGLDSVVAGMSAWVGHSTPNNMWHYHDSAPPLDSQTVIPTYPKGTDLVGYAFDGFPIYGPLEDDSTAQLDVCNGRWTGGNGNPKYQYHMKKIESINTTSPYCVDWQTSVVNQWNYFLGCYSGTPMNSLVTSYVRNPTVLPLSSDYKCTVHVGKKSDVRDLIGADL